MTITASTYRPEIDGLRCMAVLPVLFFHADIGPFTGGFVGVDVFFVISGYLITSIIWQEIGTGRFSIAGFYERRARRILPALYTVMAASMVAGWFLMLPEQLENFGQSVVATVLFSNNILLTLTAGYWETSVDFKPLVHTWSLAVEEQFYIAFPLLLLTASAALKSRRRLVWLIGGIAVTSFACVFPLHGLSPSANFYLVFSRAWELLAGALVVLVVRDRSASQALSFTGLALILLAIVATPADTMFPGPATLLPVVGTVLVIMYANPGTLAYDVLSSRTMVQIGLISYSLYLWHQPLFAFVRIYARDEPKWIAFAAAIATAFVLAWLTWRFVEQPFRDRTRVSIRAVWFAATVGSAALIAAGMGLHFAQGVTSRLYDGATGEHISYNERIFELKREAFPDRRGVKVLITGNSYGRDFANMLLETYGDAVNIVYSDDMTDCFAPNHPLVKAAQFVVIASGTATPECIARDIAMGRVFYLGKKNFGANLNWIMREDRLPNLYNRPTSAWLEEERAFRSQIPAANYLSVYDAIRVGDTVPVTDSAGMLVSSDTFHLTQAGARLVGRALLKGSAIDREVAALGDGGSQNAQ